MERFAEKIVQKCVQMNLIEEDQSDWLPIRYSDVL